MTRTTSSPYEAASTHYLSPDRRDPVKRCWEEPLNHHVLATAIAQLDVDPTMPLRVVDVGAGTGDGVALLDRALDAITRAPREVSYLGLDADPGMVATARVLYADRAGVDFVEGDVRDGLPVDDAHVYLSAGVPYSHLAPDEFLDVLTRILDGARRRDHRTAVVLDVLGRYSLEWVPRWASERWDYAMSFFHGAVGADHAAVPMTFYDRRTLGDTIRRAARACSMAPASVHFYDRSVMVGRHTATGAFNPGLPPYRELVNRLYRGDAELDLDRLRLTRPDGGCPDEVSRFFVSFAERWNARLDRARRCEERVGVGYATRTRLAEGLCALEHRTQQGLGTGHSLIAVVVTDPTGDGRDQARR